MSGTESRKAKVKRVLLHELVEYFVNFAYLAFFFIAFAWYRRFILGEYHIASLGYWLPLIEAAILAKIIMIGDIMRLGSRMWQDKPLIVPTLFRTVMFAILVAVFAALERTVEGLFHGEGWGGGVREIREKGLYALLAECVVVVVAFIPYFAFKELGRVLGEGKLKHIFFVGLDAQELKPGATAAKEG
jgi:hypothetical protein